MLNKNKLRTGITALGGSERYPKTRLELLKESQKPDAWWLIPLVTVLIMAVLMVADYSNIYAILSDVLLFLNPVFLCILSIVLCLVLSLLPILLAYLIRKRQYEMDNIPVALLIAIPAIFFILIGILGWVRYSTGSTESYNGNMMQSIGGSAAARPTATDSASIPMVFLLTFLPIGTGIVNFLIAWWSIDPLHLKINKQEVRRLRLFEHIVQLEAFMAEYSDDACGDRLYKEDDAKYMAAIDTAMAAGKDLRAYYRVRLAEHLAEPVSISFLSKPDNLGVLSLPATAEAARLNLREEV